MFWSETLTCISYYVVDVCIRKENKKKNLAIRNKMVSNMAEKKKRMEGNKIINMLFRYKN